MNTYLQKNYCTFQAQDNQLVFIIYNHLRIYFLQLVFYILYNLFSILEITSHSLFQLNFLNLYFILFLIFKKVDQI